MFVCWVLQALQSWKTQICPEGEHPASLELWRDSFSAFIYVCVCSYAWTSLCSSRAPFTNVIERARSKLVCLIQSCVCSVGGFASLIPLQLLFFILAGFSDSNQPWFLSFFLPAYHLWLLSSYYQVVPPCSSLDVIAQGSLEISHFRVRLFKIRRSMGFVRSVILPYPSVCYKALNKLLVIFLHN